MHRVGRVAERFKALALKSREVERLPGVRIPPRPPKKLLERFKRNEENNDAGRYYEAD